MGTSSIAGLLVIIIIITDCTESTISPEDAEMIFFKINFTNIVGVDSNGYVPWDYPDQDNIYHTINLGFGARGITTTLDPNFLQATVVEQPVTRNSRFQRLWIQKAIKGYQEYYFRNDPGRSHLFMFTRYNILDRNLIFVVEGYVPTHREGGI